MQIFSIADLFPKNGYHSTCFAHLHKYFLQPIVLYSMKKKMSKVKYKKEKFNGENGFSMWQRRMSDLLIQQGLHKALGDKFLGIGKK